MRIGLLLCCMGLMVGAVTAPQQDTNFPAGPQYLNTGSATFARPISTPSMSLSGPKSGAPMHQGPSDEADVSSAQGSDETEIVPVTVASPSLNLTPIYYGTQQVIQTGDPRTGALNVVFLKSPQESAQSWAPESHMATSSPTGGFDLGAGPFISLQSLQEEAYGVTLPQAASYQKEHAAHAARRYTNADIDRLRSGG